MASLRLVVVAALAPSPPPRREPLKPPPPGAQLARGVALAAAAATVAAAAASPPAFAALAEPANALSLPTWAVHVSSVAEWVTAMALVWDYGERTGLKGWKGLSWGMDAIKILTDDWFALLDDLFAANCTHAFLQEPFLLKCASVEMATASSKVLLMTVWRFMCLLTNKFAFLPNNRFHFSVERCARARGISSTTQSLSRYLWRFKARLQ